MLKSDPRADFVRAIVDLIKGQSQLAKYYLISLSIYVRWHLAEIAFE